MTVTFDAHFDGKVLVPDEPRTLPTNTRLRVTVTDTAAPADKVASLLSRLPLIALPAEDAQAINLDPEFDVEES